LLLLRPALFAAAEQPTPTFQDYSVSDIFRGSPVAARPASAFALRYRTVIREGARKGPNFSGDYTVVIWGCGTSCAQFAIVDATTGHTYDPPYFGITWGDQQGFLKQWGLHYQLNSSLFIADGCPEERSCAARYYRWDGKSLVLLKTLPVERVQHEPEPSSMPSAITVKP
jgi:hypothetical protein